MSHGSGAHRRARGVAPMILHQIEVHGPQACVAAVPRSTENEWQWNICCKQLPEQLESTISSPDNALLQNLFGVVHANPN